MIDWIQTLALIALLVLWCFRPGPKGDTGPPGPVGAMGVQGMPGRCKCEDKPVSGYVPPPLLRGTKEQAYGLPEDRS